MTAIVWVVAGALFVLGLAMIVMRRQLLAMLFGLELALCAVNLVLVRHAGLFGDAEVLAVVALVMAVAAGEAVIGLSLILEAHRDSKGLDAGALSELRG